MRRRLRKAAAPEATRDEARDEGRDLERDPHRDEARDEERDVVRDAQRDRTLDKRTLLDGLVIITVPLMIVLSAAVAGGYLVLQRQADARARDAKQLVAERVLERGQITYELCLVGKANRDAIRASITRSDPLRLQPGDYGYSYAQEHPAEARRASEELREELRLGTGAFEAFPRVVCVKPAGTPVPKPE